MIHADSTAESTENESDLRRRVRVQAATIVELSERIELLEAREALGRAMAGIALGP